MKLYELPNKSYFCLAEGAHDQVLFFDHPDGMYSYCLDANLNVVHIYIAAEVIPTDKFGEAL